MNDEKRYTLDEAKAELRRIECDQHGHDYLTVSELGKNEPDGVTCTRCGQSWKVYASRDKWSTAVADIAEVLRAREQFNRNIARY